jgi:hypothetical protein
MWATLLQDSEDFFGVEFKNFICEHFGAFSMLV